MRGDGAAGEHDVVGLHEHDLGPDVERARVRCARTPSTCQPVGGADEVLHLDTGADRRRRAARRPAGSSW